VPLTAWLGGTALVALVAASSLVAGRHVRRWLAPAWSGAMGWLVDLVVALAIVIGSSQLIGAVGLFHVLVLPVAVVAASGGVVAVARARATAPGAHPVSAEAPGLGGRDDLMARAAAIGAVAVVVGRWAGATTRSLQDGIVNADSLWYHLPRAARFARSGWVTPLHHTAPEFPDAFHPANAELVQAIPMLLYGRDAVAPLVNLAWLGLALLAGWCVGIRAGRAPLTLLGVCALVGSPLLVVEGAGNAGNDLAAVALLLAAVAILLQPGSTPGQVAIAGIAAGLAISTKLTVIPAVGVLTVGVVWCAPRGGRLRRAVTWAVPLLAFGAYWYLRNLVTVGSPVPSTNLPVFGHRSFAIVDELGFSVADYLTDGEVWRSWFLPGLRADFGWGWPLLAVGVLVAVVASLLDRRDRITSVVGVAVVATTAAYVVLPTTALGEPGEPVLFAANVVYLLPALLLALALLPTLRPVAGPVAARGLLAGYAGLLGLSVTTSSLDAVPDGTGAVAVGAAVLTVVAGVVAIRLPSVASRRIVAGLVVAAVVVSAFVVSDRYVDGRYEHRPFYRWANELSGADVAIAGFGGQFPFYGVALGNDVDYVGRTEENGEFHDVERCEDWRRALRDRDADYVVLRPERTDVERQLSWTRSDPAATPYLDIGGGHVFRYDAGVPDPGCP
jgi:hypothetical protein